MTTTATPLSVDQLLAMSSAELDEAFAGGSAATIPDGVARGTAIVMPGTAAARPLAALYGLVWRGKAFDAGRGELVNLLTPLAFRALRADVSRAESRFDGSDCVVIDYAQKSRIAGRIRDEIREVSPGLWLGIAWVGRRRILRFAVAFGA